ncbi:hypothetical protein [Pseudomonas sp. NPDC089569]|uniref:hypothetical protein n=1 Tax=Pseudomonas sp. NPDC089569 TaxID=3390722 RepID=UPI003D03DB3B
MNDATIKAIFLANGFKEKDQGDGHMGLNPNVYDAARALISAFAPPADIRRPFGDSLLYGAAKAYTAALTKEADTAQGMINAMRKTLNKLLASSPANVWTTVARLVGHDEHTFDQWYEAHGKALLSYELGCEHLMEAAWDAGLARHPTPRRWGRAARTAEEMTAQDTALYKVIHQQLSHYRLQEQQSDSESGYPLVDALTAEGAEDISSGQREIDRLADHLFGEILDKINLRRDSLESLRDVADWNREVAGSIGMERYELQAEVTRLEKQLKELMPAAEAASAMLADQCPNSTVGNELARVFDKIARESVTQRLSPTVTVSKAQTGVPKVALWVVAHPGGQRYFQRYEDALQQDPDIAPIALITLQDHLANVELRGQFKETILHALLINHALKAEHENDPEKALSELIKIEVAMAIDPAISGSPHITISSK